MRRTISRPGPGGGTAARGVRQYRRPRTVGGGPLGGEIADPGHDHQHPGLGAARRAAAGVHPRQRVAGQDARRGQRPGHRARAPRRSRRAAGALAGRGAGVRGRGHGRAAAVGDAQRLRARRAGERSRRDPRSGQRRRGHEDRRGAGAVRLPRRRLGHQRPGEGPLEEGRDHPGGRLVPGHRAGHGGDAAGGEREGGLHPVGPGHLPGPARHARARRAQRGRPRPAERLPRDRDDDQGR